jgi:hypothetical protein
MVIIWLMMVNYDFNIWLDDSIYFNMDKSIWLDDS